MYLQLVLAVRQLGPSKYDALVLQKAAGAG